MRAMIAKSDGARAITASALRSFEGIDRKFPSSRRESILASGPCSRLIRRAKGLWLFPSLIAATSVFQAARLSCLRTGRMIFRSAAFTGG
jgi:hypothetical protein